MDDTNRLNYDSFGSSTIPPVDPANAFAGLSSDGPFPEDLNRLQEFDTFTSSSPFLEAESDGASRKRRRV